MRESRPMISGVLPAVSAQGEHRAATTAVRHRPLVPAERVGAAGGVAMLWCMHRLPRRILQAPSPNHAKQGEQELLVLAPTEKHAKHGRARVCWCCCRQPTSPGHAGKQVHDVGSDLLEAQEGGVARGGDDVPYALHALTHRDVLTKPAQHSTAPFV